MAKCLDCEKIIEDGAEFCSTECFKAYFLYVFEDDAENHPEFKRKIAGENH